MLVTEPCALLTLDMTRCHMRRPSRPGSATMRPAFEGTTLACLLEPETGRLACRRLRMLKLSSTGIEGELPPCLEQCDEMIELELKSNHLVGPLPRALLAMSALKVLNLSRNQLSGEIPDAFEDCHTLEHLLLSWNDFDGPVPPSIGKCKNLQILNLAGNKLSGEIPPCYGLLQKIQKLFLDDNCLTGSIPAEVRARCSRKKAQNCLESRGCELARALGPTLPWVLPSCGTCPALPGCAYARLISSTCPNPPPLT